MMRIYVEFIMKYKIIFLILIGLLTAYFSLYIPSLKINNNEEAMFNQDDPDWNYLKNIINEFGSDESLYVYFKCDDVFDKNVLSMIDRITKKLENIKYMQKVYSITNIYNTISKKDSIIVEPIINDIEKLTEKDLRNIKSKVLSDSIYYKYYLISKDGTAVMLLANIDKRYGDVEYRREIVNMARDIVKVEGEALKIDIHLGGPPYFQTVIAEAYEKDTITINPIMGLLICLLLFAIFRRLSLVYLTMLVIGIAVVWTMGLIALSGKDVNWVTEILIPLLLVIGVLDCVHIISQYLEISSKYNDKRTCIIETVKMIGLPCFLTSLTTIIGFISLTTSNIIAIRDLGIYASFGIMVLFIISFSLFLIAISWQRNDKTFNLNKLIGLTKELLSSISEFSCKYRNSIILVFIVIVTFFSLGITKIKVDTNPSKLFKDNSEILRLERFILDNFGYWMPADFILDLKIKEGVKNIKTLKIIEGIQNYLETFNEIDRTLSIVDLIKKINQEINGGNSKYYIIPEDEKTIIEELFLYSISGGEESLNYFTDDEFSMTRITARIKPMPSKETVLFLNNRLEYINKNISKNIEIKITGTFLLLHKIMKSVSDTQLRSFTLALIIIVLVMSIFLRSYKLGFLSIIPNIFPVIVTLGIMGWLDINLDIATAMVASIIIGLAVDDTIHLLFRFKKELLKENDYEKAIKNTIKTIGKPILFSSIVLTIGFWVLTASSYLPVVYFGFLSGIAIISALLADLIILPAILLILKPIKLKR